MPHMTHSTPADTLGAAPWPSQGSGYVDHEPGSSVPHSEFLLRAGAKTQRGLKCGSPDSSFTGGCLAWHLSPAFPPPPLQSATLQLTLSAASWHEELADGDTLQLSHINSHDCGPSEVINVHRLPQPCEEQSHQVFSHLSDFFLSVRSRGTPLFRCSITLLTE